MRQSETSRIGPLVCASSWFQPNGRGPGAEPVVKEKRPAGNANPDEIRVPEFGVYLFVFVSTSARK